ncbi:hypothetical protein XA68_17764 [Ophiocordyceps unilateralis]|uniref:Ribosomal RNA methyltransferase FtsJ domain-containing protein n=1 Tax=Ophiocordyceps unilateralis TaxID=268505 RepID=A0A2A9PRT0_OPHUN|nr:hypothetical protein XA68_17764 [Ophiocordyceps unilateralis]
MDMNHTQDPGSSSAIDEFEQASNAIVPYLMERSDEFRELVRLRKKGWQNAAGGDAYFQRQRQLADTADDKTALGFYKVMQKIARQLHQHTGAFSVPTTVVAHTPYMLDMCMAPGGFLISALRRMANAQALAFSLPMSSGGHRCLVENDRIQTRFLDITMLAEDMGMGVESISPDHPDAGKFLPRQLEPNQLFDLVICDGHVLRTHSLPAYRQIRESSRLINTQLALGLEHLRPGGTIIVRLHKLESWPTATLIRTFSNFSSIRLYKPEPMHAKRSSFYMVASAVSSRHPLAIRAVERWKAIWRAATFGSGQEYRDILWTGEDNVHEFLDAYGPQMVELGREIWRVQAKALAKAPFIRESEL